MGHKIKDKVGRRQPTKRIQIIRVQTDKSIIKNKKNKKERLAGKSTDLGSSTCTESTMAGFCSGSIQTASVSRWIT